MRRQRQESPSKNNGSINHQATDYTLNLLPSCSKDGVHFVPIPMYCENSSYRVNYYSVARRDDEGGIHIPIGDAW